MNISELSSPEKVVVERVHSCQLQWEESWTQQGWSRGQVTSQPG